MFNNVNIETNDINAIIKKTIGEINSSREQIFIIVDSIRNEQDDLKRRLNKIKDNIRRIIGEVDDLDEQDKAARRWLAEVSANFNKYNENDIKDAYENASDIRIALFTKQTEEKSLREQRDELELSLKKVIGNIEGAEKVINQISIAMGYLEGDILPLVDDADKNSEMYLGIRILEAQENERKRIARDIHDGPAQHMANIVMRVDICKMMIQKDLEAGLKEFSDLKESVKTALKEVRSIIFDLRPISLGNSGLNHSIEQVVSSIAEESNIEIDIRLKPINKEIETIIQVAVYRIIQEIFNNIKKHSMAKRVNLKLDFGTKYLVLKISDDGIGFNVEETLKSVKTKGTSYGLMGILDRVKQLQGEIEIKSSIGEGTTYNVKLPISREVLKNDYEDSV